MFVARNIYKILKMALLEFHMEMEPHHKRDSSRVSVIRKDDRHGLVLKGIVEGIKYALNTFTSTKGITRCQGVAFPFVRLLFCGTDIAIYMKRSARILACDHIRVKRCAK
jgi:hypothetical protein